MTNMEAYLPWLLILAAICCLWGIYRWWKARKAFSSETRFVRDTLQSALEQKAAFDLKLMTGDQRAGIAANLAELGKSTLALSTKGPVSPDWQNQIAEAYFRVGHEDSAVFYVFDSKIGDIKQADAGASIIMAMPSRLRVEKKRHFLRVRPSARDILMIGVWPMQPGNRLPRANNDIGQPPMSWKSGSARETVGIENVSGSGIALTFENEALTDKTAFNITPGRQLLCLLVFRPDDKAPEPMIFWCAGEIKNVRKSSKSVTLGMEFTNTAVQAQGSSEIHWTHSSPWRGVKPMIQWVQKIDRAQN